MRFLKCVLVCMIVIVSVGCGRLTEEEYEERALGTLIDKPEILHEEELMEWDDYFKDSRLGRIEGTIPDYEWFVNTKPLFLELGGEVGVNWVGVPGCELKEGEELRLGYWPELYDDEGFKCYVWWDVLVTMSKSGKVRTVAVRELGDG